MFRLTLSFTLALLTLVSAGEYLAVVNDLVETRAFHVIEQVQNRSLVIVNDEEIEKLQTRIFTIY